MERGEENFFSTPFPVSQSGKVKSFSFEKKNRLKRVFFSSRSLMPDICNQIVKSGRIDEYSFNTQD